MEAFMDQLNQVVVSLQSVMSGKVLVVLLVGTGIWFTIRLRGVQFREFGKSLTCSFQISALSEMYFCSSASLNPV